MNSRLVAVLVTTLLAATAAAQAPVPREPGGPETVSVSGTGRAELTPDRAVFTVGVQTVAPTVAAALQENNSRVAAIIATLKRLGAADREIRTSQMSIYPQQDHQAGRLPRITGYQVSNSVIVTRDDPSTVGKLLQAAVDAGANSVSGVGFVVSDPARGRDAALQAAFADARAKAEVLARAAGRALGRTIAIAEGGGVRPPMPMPYAMKMEAQASEVPIMTGTEEVTFSVSVVFELR
ncbi:MAG TPA: SIMPL domain-containing protein [Vicinamibacteria bacterium]|jgi:hypothetical protein|nr:SIMPL domain-containing protein [Vicinamibacteria bacterium]